MILVHYSVIEKPQTKVRLLFISNKDIHTVPWAMKPLHSLPHLPPLTPLLRSLTPPLPPLLSSSSLSLRGTDKNRREPLCHFPRRLFPALLFIFFTSLQKAEECFIE